MDPWTAVPAPDGKALLLRSWGGNRVTNAVNFVQFSTPLKQSNSSSNNTPDSIRKNLNVQFTPSNGYNLSAPENSEDEPQAHLSGFCEFSPRGTYITRFDSGAYYFSLYDPRTYEWDILDSNGQVAYQMTPNLYPASLIPPGCVTWTNNETSFYSRKRLKDTNAGDYIIIYKYNLKGNNKIDITPYFTKTGALDPYMGRWEVSPDGNYILYEEACGQDGGCAIATVVGPNNTVAKYPGARGLRTYP